MKIRSFWNYAGSDIVKVMKSVALVSAVFTGIMAEFVVPIIMLVGLGYKEIPFRTYMIFWVIATITTIGITFAFGLSVAARYWHKTRLPYNKVVDEHDKFLACPLCDGIVEQKIFGGLMPMVANPVCQSCRIQYRLREKFLLDDEFEVVRQP